jgi:hypothetical protein
MKVHTALNTGEGEPFPTIWCKFEFDPEFEGNSYKFEFDPEFEGNSYEFQHLYVEQIYGAIKSLLEELSVKAEWEAKMELAETDEDLRDVARDMLEKIDDGFFDDDGGEERRKRGKLN